MLKPIDEYTKEEWAALQDQADAVQEIDCGALMENLGVWDADYDTSSKAVMDWCRANNAHYYGRDNESFSRYEARREAAQRGMKIVVLDNMS